MGIELNNKYVFLSLYGPGYSRTWTSFSYLSRNFSNIEFVQIQSNHLVRDLLQLKKRLNGKDFKLIVSSPSQLLVIPIFFFFKQKPVLDAGWSLFESSITSRSRMGRFHQSAAKNYLIDFFASQLSSKVILESELQKKWYSKIFMISGKKCYVNYTGVDEIAMETLQNKNIEIQSKGKREVFRVVFRGKENPESGLDVLELCTQILAKENIEFMVISPGLGARYRFSTKTIVVNRVLDTKQEIANLMVSADLSLGQLSSHHRTKRTIPHKAFESALLGIPYLTARSSGVLEIFKEGKDIACFDPGSAKDLARAIVQIRDDKDLLQNLKKNIQATYREKLSQQIIATKLVEIIEK